VVKFDHVAGFVPGSVTSPAQFGAIGSVTLTFFSASFPLLVTLILNTACAPEVTVCVSFPIFPSRSALFASLLSISISGVGLVTAIV